MDLSGVLDPIIPTLPSVGAFTVLGGLAYLYRGGGFQRSGFACACCVVLSCNFSIGG